MSTLPIATPLGYSALMSILLLFALGFQESGLPELARIFLEDDRAALAGLLASDQRVHLSLEPLLYDHGSLDQGKVLMAFDKLEQRYRITEATIDNSQSDTNYAWLEIYLRLRLSDRRGSRDYEATFAFHFKIIRGRMVISRWVLQDIQ